MAPDNANRVLLPVYVLKRVKVLTHIDGIDNVSFKRWEIALDIPFNVFIYNDITSLQRGTLQSQFYKCGDETPEPHYLSWNNILNNEPNFHISDFRNSEACIVLSSLKQLPILRYW